MAGPGVKVTRDDTDSSAPPGPRPGARPGPRAAAVGAAGTAFKLTVTARATLQRPL